jgi:hypothetical protein
VLCWSGMGVVARSLAPGLPALGAPNRPRAAGFPVPSFSALLTLPA